MPERRPDEDGYFIAMTQLVATRSTCARRHVGCVLVDRHRHVLATGYNGVAKGMPHCRDGDCPCEGADAASGTRLEDCEAIHAEQNALLQCPDPFSIRTVYCSVSPCPTCAKELLNTSATRLVYGAGYPDDKGLRLWERAGRTTQEVGREAHDWAFEHHLRRALQLGDVLGHRVDVNIRWAQTS